MNYVELNDGNRMPQLGFGVFQIPDHAQCVEAVSEALKTGYRLIDTAAAYANEEAVGEAVRNSNIARDELFITTKLWISDASYDGAKRAVDASLKRLGMDYLDLYLIHQPLSDVHGAYRAMEELKVEGVLKSIGVANFLPDRLADMIAFHEVAPAVNQIELNVFHQQEEARAFAAQKSVQIESWAPFAEGKNDVFHNPTLEAIAAAHNKSVAQVILRWQLDLGIVCIPKSVTPERIHQNFEVFDFSLSKEEIAQIKKLNLGKSQFFDHRDPNSVEYLASLVRNVQTKVCMSI